MAQKKMGRPTENPMPIRVGFRLDQETLDRLNAYCEKNKMKKSDVIRMAILQFISK